MSDDPLDYETMLRLARELEPEVRRLLNETKHPETLPQSARDLWIAAWAWAIAPI